MGNCYGEDGDSEDEYYGYYGKNNRLKPKPSSTPPNPNPTLSEPDPPESDHDDPNPPTLSEPDYHNTEYTNTDREDENHTEWEVEDDGYEPEGLECDDAEGDEDGDEVSEEPDQLVYKTNERNEHEAPGYNEYHPKVHGHGELEPRNQESNQAGYQGGHELDELAYQIGGINGHTGLEYEEDEVLGAKGEEYEHGELERDNGEMGTPGALQDEHSELEDGELGLHEHARRGPRTQGNEHEPHQPTRELESRNDKTHEPEYGVDETSKHGEPDYEDGDGYTHPLPTPRHVSRGHDVSRSNQRGCATTVKDVQRRTPSFPLLYTPYISHPGPTHAHPLSLPSPTASDNTHKLTSTDNGTIGPHYPNPSIARSRPPPWPDTTHNTHPQSRPPPWPD